MRDDDELCLCFHVTRRKVQNYIRVQRPRVASQLSECGGAGTGCGWCRAMLRRLLEEASPERPPSTATGSEDDSVDRVMGSDELWPDAAQYAAGRRQHLKNRRTSS